MMNEVMYGVACTMYSSILYYMDLLIIGTFLQLICDA